MKQIYIVSLIAIHAAVFFGPAPLSAQELDADGFPRIRGENCKQDVPADIGYRPSLFECNGNAAVILRGRYRNNYSVVLRRDGQYNDRDPHNPTCGTNFCSPFKTQKRIELPEFQVNCMGETGFSENYTLVKRISIKYTAAVADPNDESQFDQFCLNSRTTDLH